MFCSQCGAQVAETARFCPACGSNVRGAAAKPANTPAPKNPQATTVPVVSAAEPQRASGSRGLPLAMMGGALAIALGAGGYLAWGSFGTRLLGSADPAAKTQDQKRQDQGDKQVTPVRDTPEQAEIAAAQAALDREIAKEENEARERSRMAPGK